MKESVELFTNSTCRLQELGSDMGSFSDRLFRRTISAYR